MKSSFGFPDRRREKSEENSKMVSPRTCREARECALESKRVAKPTPGVVGVPRTMWVRCCVPSCLLLVLLDLLVLLGLGDGIYHRSTNKCLRTYERPSVVFN